MCRPCSLNDKTFEYDIVGRQINSMKAFFLKWYFFAQCINTQQKNTSFQNTPPKNMPFQNTPF